MSYLRSFFGGAPATNQDSDDVVETFVERFETATSIQDKRNALKGLRSCAKNSRLLVATAGMNNYMEILSNEEETDLIALTLEILNCVLSEGDEPLEEDELSDRLAEVIVKKPVFMPSILKWLEADNFAIRKNAVQLLTTLLRHRAGEVQDAIINDPMGGSRIVELLHEQREVIRNHVVLMLSELSRGNMELQKLLAFQNCFQLLFAIIEQESTDSIVVEDCLFVMLNLLKKNPKNQELFRINNLINALHKLTNDFLYPPEDADSTLESDWLPQKTANFIFILQVIRSLVSPVDNTHTNTHAAQRYIHQTGLIGLLCKTLLSEFVVSVDVLSETAVTVADVIRGNYANQQYLAASTISGHDGTKSALLVLLLSMTTEKQLFRLRCSVFYCFLCYLHKNDTGKQRIIDSLLARDGEDAVLENGSKNNVERLGHYICAAIVSSESVQVWFGAVCLMQTLFDADHLKTSLLHVRLLLTEGEEPTSLLTHIGDMLISLGARRLQTRCALLMLLGVWLHNCGDAVKEFTSKNEYTEYLTSHLIETNAELREGESQVLKGLIAFALALCVQHYDKSEEKSKLVDIINRRVGMENVAEALEGLTRTEFYIRAIQKPLPTVATAQELLLEYQFCKLFKDLEAPLTKIFRANGEGGDSSSNPDVVIAAYKKLIRQQDETIARIKQELLQAKEDLPVMTNGQDSSALSKQLEAENQELRRQLDAKNREYAENANANLRYEQTLIVAQQWEAEAKRFKQWAEQWQQYQMSQLPDPNAVVFQQLQTQLQETEQQLQYGWQCFEEQRKTLEATSLKMHQLTQELEQATRQQPQQSSSKELAAAKTELNALKREHDDILILLAEQDAKITAYKQKLKAHNEVVSDDEELSHDIVNNVNNLDFHEQLHSSNV
ncbi:hypothetical protein M3Y97_00748000 [Aphelenchoides bicaudatus]|nr:hypothetical protein M3Y97_00748000 [Aphelenchoides bicaudatus]